MKIRRPIGLLSGILVAMTAISIAWAQGGGFNKPVFDDAMEGTGKAARIAFGGLIGGDLSKVSAQVKTIAATEVKLREMQPPQSAEKIAEFKANADSLAARAKRVADAADGKKTALAAHEFGGMLETCVNCHAVFRKD